jgi:hypothetical protein
MEEKDNTGKIPGGADKRNPFSVPDGYFDSFPVKLAEKLQSEESAHLSMTERVWETIRPQLALAAVITAFAVIGYVGFRSFIETNDEWLSNEAVAEYIDYYRYEFIEPYFLSLLEEENFYFEDETDPDSYTWREDPDIYIDYLFNEDIDLDFILTEF